jgi:predicted  nucleic acid-binding Zn-ribbon protein
MIPEASAGVVTSSDEAPHTGLHASIVLSAYLEPLVRGRRVAILGDATVALVDELAQRGARLVHVYDPDAARVAEALARATPGRAQHQVAYAVLAGDLGVRDGAFDVAIVPDLALFADAADAIRRARRLVPATGVAAFVVPNAKSEARRLLGAGEGAPPAAPGPAGADASAEGAGTLGYYELYDLVSLQFAKVRMIGQAPFVGYTVADFAPQGEPEVSVDTSLLAQPEEPEHFLAIASDRPVSLDAYTVVELPWRDVAGSFGPGPAALALRAEAEDLRARLDALGAALHAREADLARAAREAEEQASGATALRARVVELEGAVEGREARLREIESRAGDNHVRAERLTNQIRDLDEELRRQRDRGTKLHKLLDDEKRARTKAELELGMTRGGGKDRADSLAAELEAAKNRIAELEMEQAHTQRRFAALPPAPHAPPVPTPVPVLTEPALTRRVVELEQALNAALRDVAEAVAARDAALDRAQRAEGYRSRVATVEGELAVARREAQELSEQVRAAEAGASGAEKRAARAEERAAEADSRVATAERRAAANGDRVAEAERRLAEASLLAAEREGRIAELEAQIAALDAELAAARRRSAESEHDRGAAEELGKVGVEIGTLEAALRDRGHVIARLTDELHESERVGRELLAEVEELRGWSHGEAVAAAPLAVPGDDLRARMDALATGAARSEADLQAATWRIAQLERELADARHEPVEPAPVQLELEQALAAARDEVASLRRALAATHS